MEDEQKINVRKPLFDRLVDSEPRETRELRPLRTLDRTGLKQSVRRELELLFNTRAPVPVHHLAPAERTVVDYGIPDLTSFSARNHEECTRLADTLRRAAMAYEPRLADVRVYVLPVTGDGLAMHAQLEAALVIDGVPEPVSFELVVSPREREVRIGVGS